MLDKAEFLVISLYYIRKFITVYVNYVLDARSNTISLTSLSFYLKFMTARC